MGRAARGARMGGRTAAAWHRGDVVEHGLILNRCELLVVAWAAIYADCRGEGFGRLSLRGDAAHAPTLVFGEARDFDDLVEPFRPDMLAGELASVVTKGAPSALALALVFASRGDDVDHGERSVVGQFEGWAMARVTGWTCCSRSSGIRLISAGAASRVGSSPNVAESGTKYLSPTVKRTGPFLLPRRSVDQARLLPVRR